MIQRSYNALLKELGKQGLGKEERDNKDIHILYIQELGDLAEHHEMPEDDQGFVDLVAVKYDEMLEDIEQGSIVVVDLADKDIGKVFREEHTLVDNVISFLEKEKYL